MKSFILAHRKMLGALLLVAAIVVAGYYFRMKKLNDGLTADRDSGGNIAAEETAGTPASGNSGLEVSVPDQAAGSRVTIDKVTLTKRMWVAIHEDDGGKPGKVLGAARYQPGKWEKKEVELVKPTTKGLYYAVIHSDDGNDIFESKNDLPFLVNGSPVLARFLAGAAGEI